MNSVFTRNSAIGGSGGSGAVGGNGVGGGAINVGFYALVGVAVNNSALTVSDSILVNDAQGGFGGDGQGGGLAVQAGTRAHGQ